MTLARMAINTHRLRGTTAVLERALEAGIRTVDVLGSQERSTRLAFEAVKRCGAKDARILCKVGYFEVNEATQEFVSQGEQVAPSMAHSLAPAFLDAEVAQLAELAGDGAQGVDVLLHHPERCDNTHAALERLAAMRRAGAPIVHIGLATDHFALVEGHRGDAATVARVRTSALADRADEEAVARIVERFEVIGHGALRHGDRRLVDQPLDAEPAEIERAYVAACEAALGRFAPSDAVDEDTREGCAWVQQLIADLNANVMNFVSLEMWEREIAASIAPMLGDKFEQLDEDSADCLEAFFRAYGRVVRWHATESTRQLCPGLEEGQLMAPWALSRVLAMFPDVARLSVAVASEADLDSVLQVVSPAER